MKNEFVMVPRDWAEGVISAGRGELVYQSDVELLSAAVKAEQHQGEPVALPARKPWNGLRPTADNLKGEGYNACIDEIAKLGPLYTHAQMAEQTALLREVIEAFRLEPDGSCVNPGRDFIRPWAAKLAALSAKAEPSAPVERDALKPCPFCGCQVTLLTGREDHRVSGAHAKLCPFRDLDVIVDSREAWQGRAELERKP